MNSIIENDFPGEHDLRDQLMGMISDADLAYKLPGNNPTLGELCEEMGQSQQIYTQSFKTFQQDWVYRGSKPDATNSVASLQTWFKQLDSEMLEALSGLSEEDVQNKHIDRGDGFTPSLSVQYQIYHEALLIFYAKAIVYLKAMEKQITAQWKSWIG